MDNLEKKLRAAAHLIYDQGNCIIMVLDKPRILWHEDKALNNSGHWIDASVFVPDSYLDKE